MNQHAKYQRRKSFCSEITVHTQDIHTADVAAMMKSSKSSTCTTDVGGKQEMQLIRQTSYEPRSSQSGLQVTRR